MTPDGASDVGEALHRLLAAVPASGTVLEVGSGPGWDADVLEANGVSVHRTDVTTDDLGGPYDAVLALAVLQHVERPEMPTVVGRVAAALAPGGAFLVSLREGDGEQWEVGSSGNPCVTVRWREMDFCDVLEDAGLELDWRSAGEDSEESPWLTFLVRKGR